MCGNRPRTRIRATPIPKLFPVCTNLKIEFYLYMKMMMRDDDDDDGVDKVDVTAQKCCIFFLTERLHVEICINEK